MFRHLVRYLLRIAACCLLPASCLFAQDGVESRRVFVPAEELDAIIAKDQRGVVLPKDEFLKLLRAAKANSAADPDKAAPATIIVSNTKYSARFDGEQIVVSVSAKLSQARNGWQIVTLPLAGMSVEVAKLNDKPARLGRDNAGQLILLNDARGEHSLLLELSAPLSAVGADKVVAIGVLPGVAGSLSVEVPAGKHLQLDGLSVDRPAANDQPATYQIAIGGKRTAVALQLTDRQRERTTDSLLFATTGFGLRVAPGEVTWHAVTTLQVHGTMLDRLICIVPKTLEITDVDSSGLEAWELSDNPANANSTRITLNYRQPFDGSRRIDFRGVMAVPAGESWRAPTLSINQVTSHIGRALVQHSPSVRLRTVESVGIRAATVSDADLKTIGTTGATDAGLVSLLFDVWKEDFSLGFVAQPKEQDVQASISSIFDLTATGLDLITATTIETSFAPLFDLEVALPAEWLITAVSVSLGSASERPNYVALPWQVRTKEDEPGINHIRIPLPQPLKPGQSAKLEVRAHRDPDGWPVEDMPVDVALPELRLPQSSVTEGTYVIKADADLDVVPRDITGLDPENVPVPGARLGFAYQDTRFGGTLMIERKPSRIAARTLTFARLDKQTLHAHLEAELSITGGGLRVLEVALAESAGKDLRFQLVNSAARIVEQTSRPGENSELIWTLRLDRHLVGTATLVVTSVAPRRLDTPARPDEGNAGTSKSAHPTETLPHLRVLAADRQNGFIAIEAEGDQRLTITAQDASKAVLPEVDAIDLPAPLAYWPTQRIVAAFRYFVGTPIITIADERFDRLPVPTAICREAKISSVLSPAGEFQHQATFKFAAVGVQSLRLQFGVGSGERGVKADDSSALRTDLWAALVDGQPVEVRRSDDAFLIPLRSGDDPAAERTLQLFYRTQVPELRGTGELRQPPPELTVLNGAGVSQPMQVLDQQWELSYPPELLLTDSHGAFIPEAATPLDRSDWLAKLPNSLSLPSFGNFGRMATALVVVLAVVVAIWSRYRWGWGRGVFLPALLLGAVAMLWAALPQMQSARNAARMGMSGGVADVYSPQSQLNAANFSETSDAMMATPSMRVHPSAPSPMAAEGEMPSEAKGVTDQPAKAEDAKHLAREPALPRSRAAAASDVSRTDPAMTPPPSQRPTAPQAPMVGELKGDVSVSQVDNLGLLILRGNEQAVDGVMATIRELESRGDRGGLLSLTMSLESQAGAAMKKFRYLGTDTATNGIGLELDYENRAAGWTGRWLWIAALGFIAWLLPANRRMLKTNWAVLGLTLPLALAAIAPLAWQNTLDGVFFGTLTAVVMWTLRAACEAFANAWPRMKTKAFWTRTLTRSATSAFLVSALVAQSAFAQPPAATPAPPANPNPDIPARPTIILPYDDPKEPFAAERVYLPHAKFVELWNAANPELKKPQPAPWHGQVTEALFVVTPRPQAGAANADEPAIARVQGRITLFAGQSIWVPVPLKNGVLIDAKLDDKPAPTKVMDQDGQARVFVFLETAGLHVLDLTADVPVQQTGPAGQLTLSLAPLPAGKLVFVPDREDVSFRVNGASNTFRVGRALLPDLNQDQKTKPDGTGKSAHPTFEVPINAGGDIRLAWQPKQMAGAVDAIVQSDSVTAVQVEDAGVRIESAWTFKVPRGSINDVSFSLPKELKVRSISGADVGGWELNENLDGRVLRVFLRRAVSDQTALAFQMFLETRVTDQAANIPLPTMAPLQVSRDFGFVGLFAQPQFAVKNVATKGLTQINANQFPASGVGGQGSVSGQPLSAFRYTARPFEVSFTAQRRAPESTGFAEHAIVVERRKVRMSSRLRWELAGALRSSVSVQLPPMWLPVDVDATALQDWHIDPATNVLTVEFTEPRIGAVEVVLQGNVPKEPDDAIAEISVATPLDLSKLTTQAAVWFDAAYQPTVNSSNGWKSSDPEHCSEELRTKLARPAKFVFTSNAITPEGLGFDLPRAMPKLSADSVTLVTVSDTALDYSLALQWKIAEAAADTFVFTTPDWLAGKLDFQGAGIRQTSFAPVGGDSNRTRWTITLQDPVGERYFLLATATLPPPEKREVAAPTITFERVAANDGEAAAAPNADGQAIPFVPLETQRQYVVAINISSQQLSPVGELGESVQRDELPIVVDQRLVDQATAVVRVRGQMSEVRGQVAEAAAPTWSLKSFAAQAGAPASVNLADLTTVIAADGTWRMRCVYTIKNRSRQFLALQLPENSRVLSVFVAGQPSRLVELKRSLKSKIENAGSYQLIALPKTSEADLSFQVKLVLSGRLASGALPRGLRFWSQEIDLPTPTVVAQSDDPEFGIPVARTLWSVHVPSDWTAKPVNDPRRQNLTRQEIDAADIAYRSAWLQEANELMRVIEGSNPSQQKMQAMNNLKQLGLALHNYNEASGIGGGGQGRSDEGRKLSAALEQFRTKQSELESRVVIDNQSGPTNFYVAKDQQQAAQAKGGQAAFGELFFDQLQQQQGSFQRQIVTGNNDSLLNLNSIIIANGEDRNRNGRLDSGEDENGNGVLDVAEFDGAMPEDTRLKFKLNVAPDRKPASSKSGKDRVPSRSTSLGKNVTEEDRANRRKQAVQQLDELNKAVEVQKQSQQQRQAQADLPPGQPQSGQPGQSLNRPLPPAAGAGPGGMPPSSAPRGGEGFGFGLTSNSGVAGSMIVDEVTRQRISGGRQAQGFGGAGFGAPMGGGGLGGGGFGRGALPHASYAFNAGKALFAGQQGQGVNVDFDFDVQESLRAGWTQAGGLSLPIEIQREGNVLRFSRASGAPRLALAVRANESSTRGLGWLWAAVWLIIAAWLLRWIRGSIAGTSWRHLAAGLSVLGLLGMFFLPSPISESCFVIFALASIALAVGVLRSRLTSTPSA